MPHVPDQEQAFATICGSDDTVYASAYNRLVCAFKEGIDAVTPTDVFQLMHAMDGLLVGTAATPSRRAGGANGDAGCVAASVALRV